MAMETTQSPKTAPPLQFFGNAVCQSLTLNNTRRTQSSHLAGTQPQLSQHLIGVFA